MAQQPDDREAVIPLHEEELAVERRPLERGRVRIDTHVREREARIDAMLAHEDVVVERVPIGTPVSEAPPVREEGNTLVIPLLEEVVVVERRLVLREEVRVRRVRTQVPHTETVRLRAEEVTVSRTPASSEPEPAAPSDTAASAAHSRANQDDT